eukprot:Blabericola_migrator_1__5665@NODE_287_length_10356_cov_703_489455_g233_i1_p1_GENE_NODE_287_length_10356_cov_703_489455_g233_i1NODE_287_length_10356_cov_703_489455_g233_i1_p1_ORF_typecomplete_len674_score104_56zfC2HC_2/PF13913_6/0_029zfmet/PF12874_7/9_3e02zfmet/PF12874_7/1e04zfmet/PF12874_7/0_065zfC2H2_6/PF13912_6/2_7e02zfC2H2_6/PF13912_6/1_3DUF629/PF04780_12/0_13zfRanBP/PF00641_18/0_37zfC2H2_jaz/PF12171_8/3e02zfC2H2_jaz/PF12171_8/4_1zfC2H2/PF00096_26/2_3e03zfC2H2/PF00096_26/1_7e03zfC2H2/PF00096_
MDMPFESRRRREFSKRDDTNRNRYSSRRSPAKSFRKPELDKAPVEGGNNWRRKERTYGGGGRERSYVPLRLLKLEKSRTVMLYPINKKKINEALMESAIREQSIDLGLSPPVSVKFVDMHQDTWNNICLYLRYRDLPMFSSLESTSDDVVRVCLASFSSLDASAMFSDHAPLFHIRKSASYPEKGETPKTVIGETSFHVHLVEAAPIDLFPLVRVTSHPAFLEFKFTPNPLVSLLSLQPTSARPAQIRHPRFWGLPLNSTFTIHQRRGPNRLAKPLCTVPLQWECVACDVLNICSDTNRYCSGCGAARSILTPLNVNLTDCPTELVEVMHRPCPKIRDFTLLQGSYGLHHNPDEDLYMLPDEAPERDSYAFFTREGLFYTLDIPTSTLILTHVVSIDDSPTFPNTDHSTTGPTVAARPLDPPTDPMTQQLQREKQAEELERSQANASLVASVLAQAQRAVAQLPAKPTFTAPPPTTSAPTPPTVQKPNNTGPVKFTIPKLPAAAVVPAVQEAPRKQFQEMSAEVRRGNEVNTGISVQVVDPARKPSVREQRMHQTAALEEIATQSSNEGPSKVNMKNEKRRFVEIFEETKARHAAICFLCLRTFTSPDALKIHETQSALHKVRPSMSDVTFEHSGKCRTTSGAIQCWGLSDEPLSGKPAYNRMTNREHTRRRL